MVLCFDGPRMVVPQHTPDPAPAMRAHSAHKANMFDATATFDVGHGKRVTFRLELEGAKQRSADEAE